MLKKLTSVISSRVSLLTYLAGAGIVSLGIGLVYLPAGVIACGLLLIALVFETGGRS